ncbi:farnesyl pyrophosphate synthetase 1 [Talaromyces proteolyticus]|uniref:Farnesyl pyrophosphate synthetase 1 n=1 Tax=Talaromyces proteolyticus TaxID=1131652 RepID=A0AAD4KEX1_9EURO|nr:farnesyl pyrophosphate synthetase 1 [Talaromyces proteolyticus]KAH8689305.1 farnesyl pyrophosphate synthetase 1 [Talaromyces proteolyticus]
MDSLRTDLKLTFAELGDELKKHLSDKGLPTEAIDHSSQCFNTNVSSGKLHRGLAVLYVGRELRTRPLDHENIKQLCILGWLVEILNTSYLIWDDMMDGSTTRRGQPCWYRQPAISMLAINDACQLKSTVFLFLKKYFYQHQAYNSFVELFLKAGFQTELGQLCDLVYCKKQNIDDFSTQKYSTMVELKSSYYGLYLPFVLVLEYWQLATPANTQQVRSLANAIGEYYQVHDDFIDVFRDPTTEVGTDIQENKCTWLINKALRRGNDEQRQKLQDSYGSNDIGLLKMVKDIFLELGLEQAYIEYEKSEQEKIEAMIAAIDEGDGLKREIFTAVFDRYKKDRFRKASNEFAPN